MKITSRNIDKIANRVNNKLFGREQTEPLIFDKMVFTRYTKSAETELFDLYECFEPKKQNPVGSFVRPKWIETNKLLCLKTYNSREDNDLREYFAILNYEKSAKGTNYLKNKFEKFYATRN